ncbi:MAG TPA: type II secretion system F family protein [Anaerohalosphaeraceae bacterium]|nr:type II secretion system F family protein [Anaerohalosphaeraceae bacterium]HQG05143.1 type II secretion system F family protein [Anaerohalosphaeraceae bacterium]HQI06316.1 type II secretion system F family protein [Anaerohalosphaeraceae bacterium]HQJ67064.1 type II secretion system F family protein [Anaerohalosphaeraceae bacterium]
MPRFAYKAIGTNQKAETGVLSAENAFAARRLLRSKGLHPTEVNLITAETAGRSLHSLFGSKKKAVTAFTKELATLLKAGIRLTEALSVLIQQINDPQLKNAITDVRDRVVTGESFAEALSEYDAYFDVIYVSMMRVGEVTGTLEDSLTTMANMLEKQRQLEERMTTAMMYPAVLLTVCLIVVLVIMIWFLPLITNELVKVGQTLPLPTRALMKISDVLTSPWVLAVVGALLGLGWLYRRAVRTARGAALRDRLLLALPGFGPLIKQRIVSRFSSTLATLLGSGMSMAEALRVVAQVTGNSVMAEAVRQARERILSGSDIATPLRESGVISPSIAHMITVGEKSGELEQMLRMISQNLEAESDVVIERLSKFVEPLIIIAMAGLIGLIAYATMVPIIKFSVTQF